MIRMMRSILFAAAAAWVVSGCGGGPVRPFGGRPDAGTNASGGANAGGTGSGGAPGTGGGVAGGPGSGASGGTVASGGRVGSGGQIGSGGAVGTGGVIATGGQVGSGGASASGGRVGSGGAASGGRVGSGGTTASGGAPGTGGTSGRGGTSGTGGAGAGGTTCQDLVKQYAEQMPAAKECMNLGPGTQCQMQMPGGLDCGFHCKTVVNDSRALGTTQNAWLAAGCAPPTICPLIPCVALRFGNCIADTTSRTGYRCSDLAP